MAENIGTGIRRFGQTVQAFGLDLLKHGIEENKRVKAMEAYQRLDDFLEQQPISEEEKEDVRAEAKFDILSAVKGEEELEPELQGGATRQQQQEAVSAVDVLKKGPAAGEPATTPAPAPAPAAEETMLTEEDKKPTSLQDVISPFTERLTSLEEKRQTPEYKALVQNAVKLGISPDEINKLVEQKRGKIAGEGKLAVESAIAERKFAQKERELGTQERKVAIKLMKEQRLLNKQEALKWYQEKRVDIMNKALNIKNRLAKLSEKNTMSVAREVKALTESMLLLRAMEDNYGFDTEGGGFFGGGAQVPNAFGSQLGALQNHVSLQLGQTLGNESFSKIMNLYAGGKNITDQQVAKILQELLKARKTGGTGAGKGKKGKKDRKPLGEFAR